MKLLAWSVMATINGLIWGTLVYFIYGLAWGLGFGAIAAVCTILALAIAGDGGTS